MNYESFPFLQFFNEENINRNLWDSGFFCGNFDNANGSISKVLSELGFKLDDMIHGTYINKIHPDDVTHYQTLIDRLHNGLDDSFHCEYRISDINNEWHWILTQAFVIKRNKNYTVSKIIGIDHLVDSKKSVEEYLFNELIEANLQLEFYKSLGTIGNSEENLKESLKKLKHIVEYDYCSIYKRYSEKISRVFHYPENNIINETQLIQIFKNINNSVYPVIIDDLKDCEPLSSLLIIPLNKNSNQDGFVLLCHKDRGFYKGKDLIPVKSFSELLSIVINNHFADIPPE